MLKPGHGVVAGALYRAAAASGRALPALLCDTRHTAAIWPGVTGQLRPGWCACVCQWEGSETGVLGGESRTIKHARVLPRGRGGPPSPPLRGALHGVACLLQVWPAALLGVCASCCGLHPNKTDSVRKVVPEKQEGGVPEVPHGAPAVQAALEMS